MASGPGLTSDKNFEHSCEVFHKGDQVRRLVYGKTRAEVLAEIEAEQDLAVGSDWEWDWVVIERRIPMGLSRAWTRATRGYKSYLRPN